MFKLLARSFIIALILSCTWTLKAQNQLADALRTAITGPSCVKSCFLGIEPSITTPTDVVAILEANNLTYEKGVVPNLDGYTYVVSLPNNDPRFSFVDSGMIIDILPSQDMGLEVVTSITIYTKPINVYDIISSFGRDPDQINSYELVYVDKQFTIFFINDNRIVYVDYIRLYDKENIDLTLIFDPDIRPCVEPAVLCTIPRLPLVLGFNHSGNPLQSQMPYEANFDITAEVDPQQVGSVVFSNGDTTWIDDTYPYTWTVPEMGSYWLRARPYSEAGGQGTAGTPLSVVFTMTAPEIPTATATPTPTTSERRK